MVVEIEIHVTGNVIGQMEKGTGMFRQLLRTNQDVAPLIMRLCLAVVIFPHGAQKVLGIWGGHGLTAAFDAFSKMGFPAPLAALDFAAEFLGPIALAFGFLTRVAGLGIAVVMTVAALAVHVQNGFFMNWTGAQHGEGFEYHILVLGLALGLVLQGGGKASLDGWITRS